MYKVELGDVKVTIGNTLRIEYFGQEVPALVLPFDRRVLLNGAKVFSPVDIKIMFVTRTLHFSSIPKQLSDNRH